MNLINKVKSLFALDNEDEGPSPENIIKEALKYVALYKLNYKNRVNEKNILNIFGFALIYALSKFYNKNWLKLEDVKRKSSKKIKILLQVPISLKHVYINKREEYERFKIFMDEIIKTSNIEYLKDINIKIDYDKFFTENLPAILNGTNGTNSQFNELKEIILFAMSEIERSAYEKYSKSQIKEIERC